MPHPVIELHQLAFLLPHKTCFTDFSTRIIPGSRIGIIGRNGSGKSSLLRILCGEIEPSQGFVVAPGIRFAHVPQLQVLHSSSGGERFQQAFADALATHPDILLLDEPTNHLDQTNRRSLWHALQHFRGTVLCASHDPALLHECMDSVWHLEREHIRVFKGKYRDYMMLKTEALRFGKKNT